MNKYLVSIKGSKMMQEQWKVIPDLPDYYISNKGNIKRAWINKQGIYEEKHRDVAHSNYGWITIRGKSYCIGKLVLEIFLGMKVAKGTYVLHKDNNMYNNAIDNLLLGDSKTLYKKRLSFNNNNSCAVNKRVKCIETRKVYKSVKEAAKNIGCSTTFLSHYLNKTPIINKNHSYIPKSVKNCHFEWAD